MTAGDHIVLSFMIQCKVVSYGQIILNWVRRLNTRFFVMENYILKPFSFPRDVFLVMSYESDYQ